MGMRRWFKGPNEILLREDHAVIVVDSKKFGIHEFKISLEDVDLCKERRWYCSKRSNGMYAETTIHGTKYHLHRVITKTTYRTSLYDKVVVDHINRDTQDNRRENLRVVSHRDNAHNCNRFNGGYSWNKKRQLFASTIKVNGKPTFLGYFSTEQEAAESFKAALDELNRTGNVVGVQKESGLPRGVMHTSRPGIFKAKVFTKGREIYLGTFDTPEEASAAYQAAKQRIKNGEEPK